MPAEALLRRTQHRDTLRSFQARYHPLPNFISSWFDQQD
jgi:hypothetical protein